MLVRGRWLAFAALLAAPAGTALAEPASAPVRAPAARAVREFRFDALRIDGALRGPEALVISAGLGQRPGPLHRARRSFLHRVFETIEAPALHGR